jgi:hypothetical protein
MEGGLPEDGVWVPEELKRRPKKVEGRRKGKKEMCTAEQSQKDRDKQV